MNAVKRIDKDQMQKALQHNNELSSGGFGGVQKKVSGVQKVAGGW
jgi:hypothetical protein